MPEGLNQLKHPMVPEVHSGRTGSITVEVIGSILSSSPHPGSPREGREWVIKLEMPPQHLCLKIGTPIKLLKHLHAPRLCNRKCHYHHRTS